MINAGAWGIPGITYTCVSAGPEKTSRSAASPPTKERQQTGPKGGGKAADRDYDGGAGEGGLLVRVNIAVDKTGLVTCAIRLAE